MGVLIKESFSFDRENPTCTQTWRTQSSSVVAEARACMGGVQVVAGVLQWVPPAIHPETGLICLSATADRDYGADGLAGADLCDLIVTFGIPEREEQEDQELGSVSVDIAGNMLQLERGAYEFTEGTKSGKKLGEEDVRPFRVVPEATASVKKHFIVRPNLTALLAYYGKINSQTLHLPGLAEAVPAGYARFDGATPSKKFSTDGAQFFEADLKFAIASHHWNKVWDGEQYSTVTPPLYLTADLNGVFAAI